MSKGLIRHMFPGGNTALGFYSYYNYILPQGEANRIFIIKGGPGVGKSTFMKKIAMEMLEMGYSAEFMHCSSDPGSLDGIVIPAIRIALMDGTSPHVVDPQNPGAVDEIINLGDYWDEEGLEKNKQAIISERLEIGVLFKRAYRYIKAAALIHEDTAVINSLAVDMGRVNILTAELLEEIFCGNKISSIEGKQRYLFASAITPEGMKNFLDSILCNNKLYKIIGEQGMGAEKILDKVRDSAIERGLYVESFYCALNPLKLEHLVIPDINVAFTTVNDYHKASITANREIDLNENVKESIIKKYANELLHNKKMFEELTDTAVNTIRNAKVLHDKIEAYYISNMDFEAVQRRRELTMARIIKYANK